METLIIKKKTYLNKKHKVYDIEVENEHHYFLKNGILSHNSVGSFIPMDVMSGGGGPLYNASVILFLYKSQLKDANKEAAKVDLKKTGIIVRSAPHKNRFARPITIRFHISFYKGMNPYVGLEQFINWDSCGIEKGHIGDEKAWDKLSPEDQELVKKENRYFEFEGKPMYFSPKATARNFVVRHLGATIPANELFSPHVITDEVLKELDENIIKPTFQLPDIGDLYDMEGYADDIVDSVERNESEDDDDTDVEEELENTLSINTEND